MEGSAAEMAAMFNTEGTLGDRELSAFVDDNWGSGKIDPKSIETPSAMSCSACSIRARR
jgi:hypothetical protein